MVDWSRRIVAKGLKGKTATASIDWKFARKPGVTFVKLSHNAWTGDARSPGTWAFNDEGYAVAGLTPDGYDGAFVIEND